MEKIAKELSRKEATLAESLRMTAADQESLLLARVELTCEFEELEELIEVF